MGLAPGISRDVTEENAEEILAAARVKYDTYNAAGSADRNALTDFIGEDIASNPDLVAYGASASLPLYLHGTSSTLLSNTPYFSLNKGKKIKITRISSLSDSSLADKYYIDVEDIR
jgi:hypothetical protein